MLVIPFFKLGSSAIEHHETHALLCQIMARHARKHLLESHLVAFYLKPNNFFFKIKYLDISKQTCSDFPEAIIRFPKDNC